MSQWFRFYSDALRHPKVVGLKDRDFRMWIELLSLASENDGIIPPLVISKRLLSGRLDGQQSAISRLVSAGLVDDCGDHFRPHNWGKRQYKSDTSTNRVHKYRAKRNVSETAIETPPDTDTESESPLPNGKGHEMAIPEVPIETAEFKLYRLGREVLGKNAGGLITNLLASTGSIPQACAALEVASEKYNRREYINGVIRKRKQGSSSGATDDWIT